MSTDERSTQDEPVEVEDLELQPEDAEDVRGGTESLSLNFGKPTPIYKPQNP